MTGAELAPSPTRLEFLRSVQTRAAEHARADTVTEGKLVRDLIREDGVVCSCPPTSSVAAA